MASHRIPKGVYSRDTWDWFVRANAVVSYANTAPFSGGNNGTYTLWSFTNNDPTGRSYHVQMVIGSWNTGIMTILSFASPQILPLVATPSAIDPTAGAPSGLLGFKRFDHVVASPDPLNPNIGTPYAVIPPAGFGGSVLLVRPIAIVNANTTLMLANDASIGFPFAMTIFYTIMPSGW